MCEESACNAGDTGSVPGLGRLPGEGFLSGDSQGQRSLVGCNPWGHKESDTAAQLTHTLIMCVCEGEAAGLGTSGWESKRKTTGCRQAKVVSKRALSGESFLV